MVVVVEAPCHGKLPLDDLVLTKQPIEVDQVVLCPGRGSRRRNDLHEGQQALLLGLRANDHSVRVWTLPLQVTVDFHGLVLRVGVGRRIVDLHWRCLIHSSFGWNNLQGGSRLIDHRNDEVQVDERHLIHRHRDDLLHGDRVVVDVLMTSVLGILAFL